MTMQVGSDPDTGSVVNRATATPYTANADITAAIPIDDTIPQVSEGFEILTASLTPKTTTNRVRISVSIPQGSMSGAAVWSAALFVNGAASAVRAVYATGSSTTVEPIQFEHELVPGAVSSQTYSVRVGPQAGTLRLNGSTIGRIFGGVSACTMTVTEFKA